MKSMNVSPLIKTCLLAALISFVMFSLTACSDDKSKSAKPATISHALLNAKVTDEEKQKFEQEFEKQCIAREVKNAPNKEQVQASAAEPCRCIATYLMKNLTAIEAEKFLQEHEDAHSLRIKYENAAYHCLQQKAHPKGPDFSRPGE